MAAEMGYDVATFWVSAIQLLVSVYGLAAPQADRIKVLLGIQEEIRINPPEDPKAFIREKVEAQLPVGEAAAVTADLSVLSLLWGAPIEASAFDYWSVLQELFTRIRDFCHLNNVFRFRGLGHTVGNRVLEFPKTCAALFDSATTEEWVEVHYPQHIDSRGSGETKLYLVEKPVRPALRYGEEETVCLPVIGNIVAQYVRYNSFGGYDGPPPVRKEPLAVYVIPGPDTHWLRFRSDDESSGPNQCFINIQRMLTAPAVLEIVSAIRDDLITHVDSFDYRSAVQGHEPATSS